MSLKFLYGDLDSKYRYYLFNQLNRGTIKDHPGDDKKGECVSITDNFQKNNGVKGELEKSFFYKQQELMKTLTPYKNIKATVVAIDSRYRLYYDENRTTTEAAKSIATTSGAPPIHKDINNSVVGYKNANHYKLSLGTTFNNIFTVRLLSTEIPNINDIIENGGCCEGDDKLNNKSNCDYPDVPNDLFEYSEAGDLASSNYLNSGVGQVGNCINPPDWLDKALVKTKDRVNYIYLLCPTLGTNIITPSGCVIENVFAKILMPSEAGTKYSFSTFVGDATKVFSPNTLDVLTELEFTFVHYNGCLVDFKGCENSFTLEITEIENRLGGISSQYGTTDS